MRIKLIACKALMREISYFAATSGNFIDVTFMRQGLHDTPSLLNSRLQEEIDRIDAAEDIHSCPPGHGQDFDCIALGYALCSGAVENLGSKRYPLVIPRAHDCITLLLGSREAYKNHSLENGGTFYYTASWIENALTPSEPNYAALYREYCGKYGEDNAQYLIETQSPVKNYKTLSYIRWPELPFPQYERYTQDAARYFGLSYERLEGKSSLIRDLVEGNYDGDRFLTLKPGQRVRQTFEEDIFAPGK